MRDEVAGLVVMGVATYAMLSRTDKKTLLSILIMICLGAVAAYYLKQRITEETEKTKTDKSFLEKQTGWRQETNLDTAFVATFPRKGLKYIQENGGLMDIAKKIVIARLYDRARYSDLLLLMDKLQKTYMYILDGRYHAKTQITNFLDLRDAVLENLYSLHFVVPKNVKHVYGVQPWVRIQECIEDFRKLTMVMIQVLKSYMRKTTKDPYFPELLPQPADQPFHPIRNRRLP